MTREIHAASPRLAAIEAPPALGLDDDPPRPGAGDAAARLQRRREVVDAVRSRPREASSRPTRSPPASPSSPPTCGAGSSSRRRPRSVAPSSPSLERRLGDRLLSPVAGQLAKARRLLVVPDGALHALAFAALPDPRDPAKRLIEALPVSHQVSASVHAALAGARRPASEPSEPSEPSPSSPTR